jgi:hypothetical protein
MNRRTFLKTVPAFTVLAGTASSFAKDLRLRSEQRVLFAQTVGYPV